MNVVFQKTRELGEALLQSDEYKHMKQLEDVAMGNKEAAEAMGKYIETKSKIEELLLMEAPDGEQLRVLSADMDQHHEHLQMIDDIQNLTHAREHFSDLIEQVNKVLKFIITGNMEDDESEGGCSGSCSGCASGCGHSHAIH